MTRQRLSEIQEPPTDLVEAQTTLLREPRFSDLTIKCKGRIWKCQGATLAQRCEFFRSTIPSGREEARTKTITLDDEDPDGVDLMLVYLYTLTPPDFLSTALKVDGFGFAEKAFKLGNKYSLHPLRAAGQAFMLKSIRERVPLLRSAPLQVMDGWNGFIKRLWALDISGVAELKSELLTKLVPVVEKLLDWEPFRQMLKQETDFTLDLVTTMAKSCNTPPERTVRTTYMPICPKSRGVSAQATAAAQTHELGREGLNDARSI